MSLADNNQNSEEKLTGLLGWLILVGIDIVLLPLRFIYGIASSYDFFIQSINRTISTYVTVGVFVDIGAVIMLFYTGMLFFKKRKSFPKWFIAFHSLYFLWICLRIVWMFELSIEAVYEHVVELVRQTSTVVVWIPYMLRSKRVRNTFVY